MDLRLFGKLADNCQRLLCIVRQGVWCESYIGDGGGRTRVGLREQIPNHHKLQG
jgi:hypothetical protein